MKCPKCGYMSFDFNQACPKCNKDISSQRDGLNLPSFRPMAPSLLGALTGDSDDSNIGLEIGGNEGEIQGADFSPEDSQTIEAMEEAFKDSQDFEVQLDTGSGEESEADEASGLEGETEGVDLSLLEDIDEPSSDFADLVIEDAETGPPEDEQSSEEEDVVSLDLDDLPGDETELILDEDVSKSTQEEPSLDLEDLELDLELEQPDDKSP